MVTGIICDPFWAEVTKLKVRSVYPAILKYYGWNGFCSQQKTSRAKFRVSQKLKLK